MDIKLEFAFFIVLGLVAMAGISWAFVTEKRLKKFFLGKKAQNLEDTIILLEREIQTLTHAKQSMEKELGEIEHKLRKSIRGVETIRFNPFPDQGSNQSFAIALVNEEGDGVVMSSLYSRDRMSVFAKPVKSGTSSYELSKEEKEALSKAKI